MKLLNYKEHAAELSFIDETFPFSFQKSYSAYIEHSGSAFFILSNSKACAPVTIKKNKFLISLQFYFKPLGKDAKELIGGDESDFLNQALSFIREQKLAHRIIQPTNFSLFSAVPEGCTFAPYGSYVLDLERVSNDTLLDRMQARYRTAIRATQKLTPEIKTGSSELSSFWQLHQTTMNRTNMYVEPYEAIKSLSEICGNHILIANCYINNELQGGICITYSDYGAYYLHGASAETLLSDGAIKYLHYWCMSHLKAQGVARYDFVGARLSDVSGTKLEGIQNFKRRFGTELKQGYLWKKDISPFVCMAYDSLLLLKLALKQKKMPQDIIDQERNH